MTAGLGLAGRVGVVAPVLVWLMEKVAPRGCVDWDLPTRIGGQALALPLAMA